MNLTEYLPKPPRARRGARLAPFGSGQTLAIAAELAAELAAAPLTLPERIAPPGPDAPQAPRLVDGSLGSLAGLEPGAEVLLDLSGERMLGRALVPHVEPVRCAVGGRVGALWVDTSKLKGAALDRWRELDRLAEQADWQADEPLGNRYAASAAKRWAEADRVAEVAARKRELYAARKQIAS